MTWWTIEVATGAEAPDEVAAELVRLTGQTVEERAGSILGYSATEDAARRAAVELATRFGDGLLTRIEPAAETDWSTRWRDGLEVRTVGRLRLGPSWRLEVGPAAVVIDPEMAFGSGEHGSTRGALLLMDRHLAPGGTVLDLGSGSGILTCAAVKLGARKALGIEVDPEAIPIAEANAGHNNVADQVHFVLGDAAILAPLAGPVDLVVSNILRHVNETLLAPIAAALGPDGVAVFAGMEESEAELFRPVLAAAGWRLLDETIDAGWWAVAARAGAKR